MTCDPAKVLSKLKEFNNQMDDSLKVTDTELEHAIKLASGDYSSVESIDAMKKLLLWPKGKLNHFLGFISKNMDLTGLY